MTYLMVEPDPKEQLQRLESERAARERRSIIELCQKWVWISDAKLFVRREDQLQWTEGQFYYHYAHLVPKSNLLNVVMRTPDIIQKFERFTFEPGKQEIIDGAVYNLWRPGGIASKPGDATWFVNHLRFLLPEGNEAELVLDFLALLVQSAPVKIHFALLIVGVAQGTGKSAIVEVVRRMIGTRNVRSPSNEEVNSQYSAWQLGVQLVAIDELMTLGRQQLSNRLKPVITDSELRIRAMWSPHYTVPNHLNIIATSNHANALKIDNSDRRWLVVRCPVNPKDSSYYKDLFNQIRSDDSIAAVKHMLENRDVRLLEPKGRAPLTAAKLDMQEQSLADVERHLLDLFESCDGPFRHDIIRREDLIEEVRSAIPGQHRDLIGRLDRLLKERLGARLLKRAGPAKDRRPRYRLWSLRNHEHWEKQGPTACYNEYVRHANSLIIDPAVINESELPEEEYSAENNYGY